MSTSDHRVCLRCHERKKIEARGLCISCYRNALQSQTVDQYPVSGRLQRSRERAARIVELLEKGLTRREVADRLGLTFDTVHGVARRQGFTQTRDTVSGPPGEPACSGSNHPGFILELSGSRGLRPEEREHIAEALTFCERCPLAVRQWCTDLINPARSRWTGVAGGAFYVDGQRRGDVEHPPAVLQGVSA